MGLPLSFFSQPPHPKQHRRLTSSPVLAPKVWPRQSTLRTAYRNHALALTPHSTVRNAHAYAEVLYGKQVRIKLHTKEAHF